MLNFIARVWRRTPADAADGRNDAYTPEPEGDALLDTGADQVRAYLLLHPGRAAALEASCLPLRERLAVVEDPAADEVAAAFPQGLLAARAGAATMWDAVFTDLNESTGGGPGITLSPLVVLMSRAVSHSLHGAADEGLLYVSSDARAVADRLLDEVEGIGFVVAELMDISRSTIGARATQAGIDSVLMHRRFRTESVDLVRLHQLEDSPSRDLVERAAEEIDFHTLSVWFADIETARDWLPAADPASTSVVVLSVRVPVFSIWLAPRREPREFLISAEALVPEHSEILNRD